MTIKKLRERARYWQDRLNLREWTIAVRYRTPKEIKAENLQGCCLWHTEELCAIIAITPRMPDQEATLVHELLHIVLQGHGELSGEYDVHLERAINRLSAALMESQ